MNYSGTGSAVQPEGIMGNHLYSNRASILLPYIPSEPCTAHYLPPTTDGRQQCVCGSIAQQWSKYVRVFIHLFVHAMVYAKHS